MLYKTVVGKNKSFFATLLNSLTDDTIYCSLTMVLFTSSRVETAISETDFDKLCRAATMGNYIPLSTCRSRRMIV